jgi:hypothetical protein
VLLIGIALMAPLIPALRATRVDRVVARRAEYLLVILRAQRDGPRVILSAEREGPLRCRGERTISSALSGPSSLRSSG